MSQAPRIPGMSDFPELEKKYRRAYRAAVSQSTCGGSCDAAQVIRAFKEQVAERRRDKDRSKP